jgi:hypothetical protein
MISSMCVSSCRSYCVSVVFAATRDVGMRPSILDMTTLRHGYRWRGSTTRIRRVGVLRIGAIGQQRRDKEAHRRNISSKTLHQQVFEESHSVTKSVLNAIVGVRESTI